MCAFLSDCVDISVSVSRGGATNQRGYIVTGIPRHRSHFGSRYKLGCCGHASLFGGGESLNIYVSCFVVLSDCVDISVSVSRGGAINQRGYIVTGILRHRSHFGSRYKLGCCGHASLFGGGESLNICFVFCFLVTGILRHRSHFDSRYKLG